MGQICVFFGHRFIPNQSLVKAGLTDVILDLIRSKGVDEFWLGGMEILTILPLKFYAVSKRNIPLLGVLWRWRICPQIKRTMIGKKVAMTMFSALKGLKKDLCALPFVGGISGCPKMRILLFAMWIPKAVALIRLYA